MPLRAFPILEAAVADGIRFSDFPKEKSTTTKSKPQVESLATKSPKKPVDNDVIADIVYRFTEEEHVAYEFKNGKKHFRSLRSACNGCGYSLVVCYCSEPVIVAEDGSKSVRVYMERKSA